LEYDVAAEGTAPLAPLSFARYQPGPVPGLIFRDLLDLASMNQIANANQRLVQGKLAFGRVSAAVIVAPIPENAGFSRLACLMV